VTASPAALLRGGVVGRGPWSTDCLTGEWRAAIVTKTSRRTSMKHCKLMCRLGGRWHAVAMQRYDLPRPAH